MEVDEQQNFHSEIDDLPDEILIAIFDNLNSIDILKIGLVCKKWLNLTNECHIMRKIAISINTSKLEFVDQVKFLKRNYRHILLDHIDCSILNLGFVSILQHVETLIIFFCSFVNERTLNVLLSSCKRLKKVWIDFPKLDYPEPLVDITNLVPIANLEDVRICFKYKKSWTILKAFQMVPFHVKTLKLVLVLEYFTNYAEIDCMLKYIHQFYQASLKDLSISMIYKADDDFDRVIEQLTLMDDLKLTAFSSESFNDTLFKVFFEKQVHLKSLKLEKNVTQPQLRQIGGRLVDLVELGLTLDNVLTPACINNLINSLPKLKKVTLRAKCGVDIDLQIPPNLQEFDLYSHGTFNLTELRLLPATNLLENMKRFSLSNIIFKDQSLNEVFKTMVNLQVLTLSDVHQMTGNGLLDRFEEADPNRERYSIGRLQKLVLFSASADVIDDDVLMEMRLPNLRFFNLEGDLEDLMITDKGLSILAENCKHLYRIQDECYKTIYGRNVETQTFDRKSM